MKDHFEDVLGVSPNTSSIHISYGYLGMVDGESQRNDKHYPWKKLDVLSN